MRAFPKSLAAFRKIVDERGQQLRNLTQEELKKIGTAPFKQPTVESRPATIGIIVQPKSDGSLRVVIQGFMEARFVAGRHAALDGFYKHSDGAVSAMPAEELYEFDWRLPDQVALSARQPQHVEAITCPTFAPAPWAKGINWAE